MSALDVHADLLGRADVHDPARSVSEVPISQDPRKQEKGDPDRPQRATIAIIAAELSKNRKKQKKQKRRKSVDGPN